MIFNNRIDIFEENKRLREELEQERRLRKQWQEKCLELETAVKELECRLNRILNPNTPSSQVPFTERDMVKSPNRNAQGSKPRGKPKGGNGGIREHPKHIDKKENATAKTCDGCSSKNLLHTHIDEIPVWDLPIIKLIVTLFYVYVYICKDCGKEVRGSHPDLPLQGMIGPNLAAFLAEVRHNFAGSYSKLSAFLEDLTGETFTGQAIKDCIRRTAKSLKPSYETIREKLREEKYSHSDETKWPVGGVHWYLWLLCTLNFVFIEINESRGRKVLIELLGEFYQGVIISDCLKVYRKCAEAFQKCWAHLLRKTFYEKEKHPTSDVALLHRQLSDLYEEAENSRNAVLSQSERIWTGIRLNQKMQRIAQNNWQSEESKGIVKNWLKEYEGQWLVGVFIPEVELTNNRDERGIRKVIPTRKMLGGHRTKKGAQDFAIIETHRQTWKLRGRAPYQKLVAFLRGEKEEAIA